MYHKQRQKIEIMYLAQTNLQVDLTNIKTHENGQEVILMEKTETQPNLDWFVFKNDYELMGRNCMFFRAIIKNNVIKNYYK